jgi:hypothetical protein
MSLTSFPPEPGEPVPENGRPAQASPDPQDQVDGRKIGHHDEQGSDVHRSSSSPELVAGVLL